MALSAEAQARAHNQAIGIIGQYVQNGRPWGIIDSQIGVRDIARRLYDNNPNVTGRNVSSYAAVARRAIAAVALGRTMGENPEYLPTRAGTPEVPTLYPDPERYRYRVLVYHDTFGGVTRHAIGTIVSETPLTGAQVEQQVRDRTDYGDSPIRGRRAALFRLPAGADITSVVIIGATRIY